MPRGYCRRTGRSTMMGISIQKTYCISGVISSDGIQCTGALEIPRWLVFGRQGDFTRIMDLAEAQIFESSFRFFARFVVSGLVYSLVVVSLRCIR
jgi:hypothetical protein